MRLKTFTDDGVIERNVAIEIFGIAKPYIKIIKEWYLLKFGLKITNKHAVIIAISSVDMIYPVTIGKMYEKLKLQNNNSMTIVLKHCSKYVKEKLDYVSNMLVKNSKRFLATALIIIFALHVKKEIPKLRIKRVKIKTNELKNTLIKRYANVVKG